MAARAYIGGGDPMGGRPGDIFEIFQNGHIFLKFLFFKNIKKKKPHLSPPGGPLPSWTLLALPSGALHIFHCKKSFYLS